MDLAIADVIARYTIFSTLGFCKRERLSAENPSFAKLFLIFPNAILTSSQSFLVSSL